MTRQDIDIETLAEELPLLEFIAYTQLERERLAEFVEIGLLNPIGGVAERWRFANCDVRRVRTAQRLIADLGVNLAGAALILDLIEERDALQARIALLERMLED